MSQHTLYMTALMGLFLVTIFVALARMRSWKHYEPTGERGNAVTRTASNVLSDANTWMLGFLLVAVGVGFAAILYAGSDLVAVAQSTLNTAVLGTLGGLVVLYVFLGTYYSVKGRGGPSARAAAVSSILLGFLVLAAIAMKLLGVI